MTEQALEGVNVLEYGSFASAPFCTKLMADLGAEVVKIEPPGLGDEARRRGPFLHDAPNPECSALFLYLNTNKLSITLNIKSQAGRRVFRELVANADILVEDQRPGDMDELGLGYQSLSHINRRLIMVSITPFGQTGPYSKYKASYLNTFHAGGEGYTLPGGLGWQLHPEKPPIKIGGYVGEYDAGVHAASATIAALIWREATGEGQHIDVSKQEALLNLVRLEMADYNAGWVESRATRAFPMAGLMQCKDGFVQVMPLMRNMWDRLLEMMGNPEWAKTEEFQWDRLMGGFLSEDPRLATKREEVNDRLAEWMLQHTMEEIYYEGQARGLAVGMVNTVADLFHWKQLSARNFLVCIQHPEAGELAFPSAPYKYSETPWQVRRPAPALGQDNAAVYGKLGYSGDDLVTLTQAGVI